MMGTVTNPAGMLLPSSLWGVYNNLLFMIEQSISKIQTATIVKIISCSNDGDVSPVGTVDVQILVNQISGQGVGEPHVTMYSLPYLRIQGGNNAIIIDPQVGDIGIAVFASRDITKVKSTKAQANPGSFRTYDFSDGMYLGGLLNGSPTQYLEFNESGLSIVSPSAVIGQSPSIQMGNGGTIAPLMTQNFLDFWNTNILPFLQSMGYAGPVAPTNSITSILEAE